jgi:hypothetical protein
MANPAACEQNRLLVLELNPKEPRDPKVRYYIKLYQLRLPKVGMSVGNK